VSEGDEDGGSGDDDDDEPSAFADASFADTTKILTRQSKQ
jgi:hypothetical protein